MCQSGNCDSDFISSPFLKIGPHSEGDLSARLQPTHCHPEGRVSCVLLSDSLWLCYSPVVHFISGDGIRKYFRRLPGENYSEKVQNGK